MSTGTYRIFWLKIRNSCGHRKRQWRNWFQRIPNHQSGLPKPNPNVNSSSFQGQSLAIDGTIVPTVDAPEFGYTRESTDTLYCPDVFYREKDEYGNNVTKIGRPLPIEYLLTDVSVCHLDFIWFLYESLWFL